MLKETENPFSKRLPGPLPGNVLYATSARIGGSGLDSVALESVRGLYRAGILGRAIAFANRQREIPPLLIQSLRFHPVRMLSCLESPLYYGAKKHYVDWIASRELASGGYDLFHGWSGDALLTLREARKRDVPCVLEIPTWHRNKGIQKPWLTKSERDRLNAKFMQRSRDALLVSRQQMLEEYDLADLILILSEKAKETFLAAGIPESRLFKIARGVDVNRFTPGTPPPVFRAVFVGALIKRKGVHLLLEAWHRLNLKDAELVLVGAVHEEMRPYLEKYASPTVRVAGFLSKPEQAYRDASVHILPSSCEGSAKTTYEAAACGLPQIVTRETGDVVIDGENGLLIPPDNVDALAAAIQQLYRNPGSMERMGAIGRKRVVEEFTWDHFRARLLAAYRAAMTKAAA